ncbi:MAG: helix-turn-helix domain-containing protein [Lachnospiraceae bacterium]
MELAEKIRKIREQAGLSRKDFSTHIGIPLRTIEDWEAGRRRPPEYIPRLIAYQLKYEELIEKKQKEEQDPEK